MGFDLYANGEYSSHVSRGSIIETLVQVGSRVIGDNDCGCCGRQLYLFNV